MAAQKKYRVQYTDYDPELSSDIYLDTEEEAFQYLADNALSELENMDYDHADESVKSLTRAIRKGKGAKALLKAFNNWLFTQESNVWYTLTRENPLTVVPDQADNVSRLDALKAKWAEWDKE